MSETKSVAVTSGNCENFSRQELLEFINSKTCGNFLKVEQLCSGTAYCQIMEMIFPNSIGSRRIKIEAKLEHEYIHNWRLLQAAFTKLKYDKTVPVDRLIKGRFQDNFEFLQWFKKFYDVVYGKENKPSNIQQMTLPSSKKQVSSPSVTESMNAIEEMKRQIQKTADERDYYLNKIHMVNVLLKQEIQKVESQQKVLNLGERVLNVISSIESEHNEAADKKV